MKQILGFETIEVKIDDDGVLCISQFDHSTQDSLGIYIPVFLSNHLIRQIRCELDDYENKTKGKKG